MSEKPRAETGSSEKSPTEAGSGVSRRDLLGGTAVLGAGALLAGAAGTVKGAVAAGGVTPVEARKNWYVRTVDRITTPYDLTRTKRFNEQMDSARRLGYAKYVGEEKAKEVRGRADQIRAKGIREEIPGWTLWDNALGSAGAAVKIAGADQWTPIAAKSPQERGFPPYDQPPEVAARHVKRAARAWGAVKVGITALRKEWTYDVGADGRKIAFEAVDQPYEDAEKRVIPEKVKNMIVIMMAQPLEGVHVHRTMIRGYAAGVAYGIGTWTRNALAEFIRSLGFVAIPCSNNTFVTIPHAIEAGMGELGRHNRMVCPDYGMNNRLFPIATDMPLAHDKPIDFGLINFCKTCMKCAESCPAKAISFEREPTWEVRGPWNNPGHKAWFEDAVACREYMMTENCGTCQSACPYTKNKGTAIHEIVKATAARTPVFNGMFARADDLFGYGQAKDAKEWWNLNLPPFGWERL